MRNGRLTLNEAIAQAGGPNLTTANTGQIYVIRNVPGQPTPALFHLNASTPVALAKADRLDIRPVGRDCSQQAWPNFEASCLRTAGSKTMVKEARLVTAERR